MSTLSSPVTSTSSLLDLLDAITEVRVRNPELRPAVLASLRLAISEDMLSSGRIYTFRFDGSTAAIISQGHGRLTEEDDARLIAEAREQREAIRGKDHVAWPLGKDKRLYGVLILEGARDEVSCMLGDLFLQWSAVGEFLNLEKAELIDENYQLREEIRHQFSDRNIVGVSGGFRRVVYGAAKVAASTATVLIQGETGTGKELIARIIHDHSPRANKPFVTVNCGALSESLLETELFGHVKGAFTGAISDRKGRFEAAHGGTIFLDEIGEISQGMQVRLLRVLQEMEVVRVGDHKTRKLDVRVVAATNRDLEHMVQEETFRADLFYRLNVVHLSVPPIRSRPEDIPPLIEHFLGVYCSRNCKYLEAVSREALEIMMAYPWPGNVRELENCIEKMVVMAPGTEITTDLLPLSVMAYNHKAPAVPHPDAHLTAVEPISFEDALNGWIKTELHTADEQASGDLYDTVRAKWERHLFEAVLDRFKNNKSQAAKLLGITRNTLNNRLGELSEVKRDWKV